MQLSLSLFKAGTQADTADTLSFNFNIPNPTKAAKLRELAASMQKTIDAKLNPAIGNQRATKRRKRIAQGIIAEGMELQTIQSWLLAIAQMWEMGNIPEVLRGISQKSQVETLFRISQQGKTPQELQETLNVEYNQDWVNSLNHASIYNAGEIVSAIREIQLYVKPQEISTTQQELNKLELEIIGMTWKDFFPTPPDVCKRLIQLAEINENSRILEPSAGSGCITKAIVEKYPQVDLEVVEINPTLRRILELKGFNLVGRDFPSYTTDNLYSHVIMNPPFSQLLEHIYHAWKLIKSGGILITIVPESVFFNRKYQDFKEWLESWNAYDESLPKNAFIKSNNPTGVTTRIIKMHKP
ncbi:SAM-dependent methyltransferase [Fischerella thermalis CCMEE 5273]|uniref:SAM-dependent methyltransferase n=1 Tax=Chlorogloeopsis fritschii PCC 6912 TaxID=211165 RepID=A0A3S0ZUH4_CHLFR|nr:methyltransferase [Chlorogloeopsis fritschii]PMB11638.1 SAM-dependent methyltransferase [Fischerella thermalis CCMEE 5273]PMB46198.1 SAM-dependent methyltransferase [Fischerella thermalis CCMEE 5205]RUR83819.1 hypothetical protein PCC6912_20620 [Chlorogloeopsis fritschii PCC 6912]